MTRRVRIVGPGRAGRSFAGALTDAGWAVVELVGRGDDATRAAAGVDLVLITTPDRVIEVVARIIAPGDAVVAHAAGSLGLEPLAPHARRAAVHPLMSLPNPETGRKALRGGWFGVAGDPIVDEIVEALGGRSFVVADADRARYHAAACVASNHLVALMGQVERIAGSVGVPLDAFVSLAAGSLANVGAFGAARALTGPAARGDDATIAAHLASLPADEHATYQALVAEARRLAANAPDQGDR